MEGEGKDCPLCTLELPTIQRSSSSVEELGVTVKDMGWAGAGGGERGGGGEREGSEGVTQFTKSLCSTHTHTHTHTPTHIHTHLHTCTPDHFSWYEPPMCLIN